MSTVKKTKKKMSITGIAIVIKLTDGTLRQILIKKDEEQIWVSLLNNFYNPIKVIETKLEGITI